MRSKEIDLRRLSPRQGEYFLLIIIVGISLSAGCSTAGSVSGEAEPTVNEEMPADALPEWYMEGMNGHFEEGMVSGFAKAVGIETSWTVDNAVRQAAANLKYKLDEALETARLEAETESATVSAPEFIRELRNAVDSLDPADYPVQSDSYEENDVTYAVVRIDIPADEALGVIERYLSGHQQTWALVRSRSVLSD